jgi:hypothetical protein
VRRMGVALVFMFAMILFAESERAEAFLAPCESYQVNFYSDSSCTQPTGWWNKGCNGQVVSYGSQGDYYTQDSSCCGWSTCCTGCEFHCEDNDRPCSPTPGGLPPY